MISKNIAEVLIGGKIVKLSGYESAEYLQKIASYINGKINEFNELDGFKRQSLDYRNLLIELNIADDYFKAKKQADTLMKEYEGKDKEIYDLKTRSGGFPVEIRGDGEEEPESEAGDRQSAEEAGAAGDRACQCQCGRRCGHTEEITCEITGKKGLRAFFRYIKHLGG